MIKVILQFAKMVTDILHEEKMGKDIVEEQRVKTNPFFHLCGGGAF